MKTSLETERSRQQELASQLEIAKEVASEEIGRISAEIETEHQDRLAAIHLAQAESAVGAADRQPAIIDCRLVQAIQPIVDIDILIGRAALQIGHRSSLRSRIRTRITDG